MIVPTFRKIKFNPEQHLYTYEGVAFKSVTQVLSKLKKPFDTERISKAYAKSHGMTQEAVKAKWKEDGEIGRTKGTLIHKYIDCRTHGDEWKEERLPEMLAFDDWLEYGTGANLAFTHVEWQVCHPKFKVAGTVDALALNLANNSQNEEEPEEVWDWKSGKTFNEYSQYKEKLNPPFDDLDQCELQNYSLQVSLYRLILWQVAGIQTSGGYILHLRPDGGWKEYETFDYQDRIESWLESRPF